MTIKPWMTRLLMLVALVIGYLMNHSLIPPGYTINVGKLHLSLAGLLNDLLAALTALGISGPQLWPAIAKMMGNGALQPATPPGQLPPPKS